MIIYVHNTGTDIFTRIFTQVVSFFRFFFPLLTLSVSQVQENEVSFHTEIHTQRYKHFLYTKIGEDVLVDDYESCVSFSSLIPALRCHWCSAQHLRSLEKHWCWVTNTTGTLMNTAPPTFKYTENKNVFPFIMDGFALKISRFCFYRT